MKIRGGLLCLAVFCMMIVFVKMIEGVFIEPPGFWEGIHMALFATVSVFFAERAFQ